MRSVVGPDSRACVGWRFNCGGAVITANTVGVVKSELAEVVE